jgi:adenosylhomocysteinase
MDATFQTLSSESASIRNGQLAHDWARNHMPVFRVAEKYVREEIRKRGIEYGGLSLAVCLHISKETSVLAKSLHDLGLDILLVAANPLSSQDEISSFLISQGIKVLGRKGEDVVQYAEDISHAAHSSPNLIIDDGGELHLAYALTSEGSCFGGTDETTSGTTRLKALDNAGKLRYPVIPVNEASTKHTFDNKYGTGQSSIDGLIRATGLLVAGKTAVVVGYGWVGQGVAIRLRGLGAKVTITEVDPVKALNAHLDGFGVLPIVEAIPNADIVLTCTGQVNVLGAKHFQSLKDGALMGNLGHFDREIDVKRLYSRSKRIEQVRANVERIELGRAKSVYLLCQGRVVNLAAAEGHPPEIMQLSFANQLLAIFYLVSRRKELSQTKSKLLPFPPEIDSMVARLALKGFGLRIDRLSAEQERYPNSF